VLHPFDDFPVHGGSQPVLHPTTASPNLYDRYFFDAYDAAGSLYVGVAFGVYANRGVVDGAVTVLHEGTQHSVLFSGRCPDDRTTLTLGPLRLEIVESFRRIRIVLDDDGPLAADLTFEATTVAVTEPRFLQSRGTVPVFDYTRVTQFGRWSGHLRVEDVHLDAAALGLTGCRDRSWGVRPIGERAGRGAPQRGRPQFFWLWAPLRFDDLAVHVDANEDAAGRRLHEFAALVPNLADRADDPTAPADVWRSLDHEIEWEPGTRRARRASVVLHPWSGSPERIDLEVLLTVPLVGLGYGHPEWGHGIWHGEFERTTWRWRPTDLDPVASTSLHVHQLVRARWGERTGTGVLELLAIGDHAPSGLSGLFDGAGPTAGR